LELFIKRRTRDTGWGLLVVLTPLFAYSLTRFSKKFVCLAWRETVSLHPWEGVDYIIDSRLFQFVEEAIGTEWNVLVHEHINKVSCAPFTDRQTD
jgi:hypothetical protein